MKEPEDPMLRSVVQAVISVMSGREVMFLIDKDYKIAHTLHLTELGKARATQARTQMLRQGDLLAVLMLGTGGDAKRDYAICEHYPIAGMTETYTLSYPKPVPTWVDQNDPQCQDVLNSYRQIWDIGSL